MKLKNGYLRAVITGRHFPGSQTGELIILGLKRSGGLFNNLNKAVR